jgi:hypothetical protein
MSVRDELLMLQQEAGGLLQVDPVIKWAAQNPTSDLYQEIPWDDAKAAQEWRRQVVRKLIALHIVSIEGVRQVVSLSIDRTKPGGGYRGLNAVMAVPDLRSILLKDALAELERVRLKYQTVSELARVWEMVERVQAETREVKQKAEVG